MFLKLKREIFTPRKFLAIIRGEPERAPNTRDTGSGFIFVCLWGDYFHEQRVKLRIANVGNGRQARVRTTLKVQSSLQKRAR